MLLPSGPRTLVEVRGNWPSNWAAERFLTRVLPDVHDLRREFEGTPCEITTSTMLRDPADQYLSFYHYYIEKNQRRPERGSASENDLDPNAPGPEAWGSDFAEWASGVRDMQVREMLGNKGVLPPEPEPETSAAPTTDLGAIAADEQEEMEGYHGLTIDDASGNKMFYTGNTLSERKRREKRQQFRKVFFYVELARHGQTIGADVERELSARQSRIAHMIYNSRRYAGWLVLVYMVQMALSFWEPALREFVENSNGI